MAGRRVVVDWTDERYSNGPNVFPLLFDCDLVDSSTDWQTSQSVTPNSWLFNLHRDAESMSRLTSTPRSQIERQLSINPRQLYDEDVAVLIASRIYDQVFHWLTSQSTYPQDWPRNLNEFMRFFVRELCVPVADLRELVFGLQKSLFGDRDVLGIHVRYTDNWSRRKYDPMKVFGPYCDKHLQNPNTAIYLATDNRQIENQLLSQYGDRCLSITKWWPNNRGKPLHNPEQGSDRVQVAKEAMTEILLLSKCSRIVAKYSTFSEYAKLISDVSPDIHIRLEDQCTHS